MEQQESQDGRLLSKDEPQNAPDKMDEVDTTGFSKWEAAAVDARIGYKIGVTATVIFAMILLFVFIGTGATPTPPGEKPDVVAAAPPPPQEIIEDDEEFEFE